jgi:heptosyltransferase I
MSWTLDGDPLRSVLVSRLRYLGDIVMSSVVPAALKRGDPDLDIGFLGEIAGAPLLFAQPDIDRVHLLESNRRGGDAAARAKADPIRGRRFWPLVLDVRRQRYDLCVDLFFNPRSAWFMRLSGSRYRIGGTRGSRRRFFTHPTEAPGAVDAPDFRRAAPGGLGDHLGRLAPLVHAPTGLPFIEWFATEFPVGLAPRLSVPYVSDRARAALEALGLPDGRIGTLLIPGATWPSKAWAPDRWGALAAELAGSGLGPVVMVMPPVGGHAYRDALASAGLDRGGVLPALALGDVLTIVAGSGRVVTVDGGLMHAAVALQRPTVALLGPTDPDLWFPYESFGPYRCLCDRPDCHPCDLHECGEHICMPALDVSHVAETAAMLAQDTGGVS